jgi:hypothetical protein
VIRPFQFGDIFLIQSLGRQAAKLNTIQTLLQPQSTVWASLSAIIPWNDAKVTTYVLRQKGHGLVDLGYLQVQKRPGRPEVEIIGLAPGLDAPRGHPAIWEKLLAHYSTVAAQQQIARIYVDLPDQPLPIHTFHHLGFRTYTHQTIWRLARHELAAQQHTITAEIRPQQKVDDWALTQLYAHTVPSAVQIAEGYLGEPPQKPPILDWWLSGACTNFVLEERGDVRGAVQIVQGRRGYWLRVWADFYQPSGEIVHQLIRHGLTTIGRRAVQMPVYVGVCDYHGALGTVLMDYGFAPITDRAKLMRPVMHWVREAVYEPAMMLKPATRVVASPMMLPAPRRAPNLVERALVEEVAGCEALAGWENAPGVRPQPQRA